MFHILGFRQRCGRGQAFFFASIFCALAPAAYSQSTFYINPEWFRKIETSTSIGRTTQKAKETSWVWQSNTQLLSAIAFMASGIVYDHYFYQNSSNGPLEGLLRCPRPDETGASHLLDRVKKLNYCQSKIGSGGDSGLDFLGSQSLQIQSTDLFKNSFLGRANGNTAYLADSYVLLPIAHRRQALAALTQIWDKERASTSSTKCDDFKAKENLIRSSIKNVAAPAVYYDCAYMQPDDASGSTNRTPFVPRDRGISSETAEETAPECVKSQKLFFLGPNCSGQALVYLPMAKKRLDFVTVRPDTDPVISPLPDDYNTLPAYQKLAFHTEITDRTMYSSGTGEVFRRSIAYTNAGSGTDLPNMFLYWPGPKSGIKSYYKITGGGVLCMDASAVAASTIPEMGDGLGYYGYVSRMPGVAENYAGFITRQFRDVYTDIEADFGSSPDKALYQKFLVKNEYSLVAYNLDIKRSDGATPPVFKTDPKFTYPLAQIGPKYKLRYANGPSPVTTVVTPANYVNQGLTGCGGGGALVVGNTGMDDLDKEGTCYQDSGDRVTLQANEYWSEDTLSDSSGIFPALLCDSGATLLNIGRNTYTYDDRVASGSTLPTRNDACIRFPLSKRMRSGTVDDMYGPAGNPLSDLSFLGFGAAGSAMFCYDDIGVLADRPRDSTTHLSPTDSYFDPTTKLPVQMNLPNTDAKRYLLDYVANINRVADRHLTPNQFFDDRSNNEMSIGTRALYLGQADDAQVKNLPINYGRCGIRKLPLEMPNNSLGPLSIPMQTYMIELMLENTENFPVTTPRTPPKCD